jgi:antitoxin FitA
MTALQIRNLPDDVHRKLKARAAQQGQSLSEYAAQVLRREAEAESPTLAELTERIRQRGAVGPATADEVADIIRQAATAGERGHRCVGSRRVLARVAPRVAGSGECRTT